MTQFDCTAYNPTITSFERCRLIPGVLRILSSQNSGFGFETTPDAARVKAVQETGQPSTGLDLGRRCPVTRPHKISSRIASHKRMLSREATAIPLIAGGSSRRP